MCLGVRNAESRAPPARVTGLCKLPALRFAVLPGSPPWSVTLCLPLPHGYGEQSRLWMVTELILALLLESYVLALCLAILIYKVEVRATPSEGAFQASRERYL